MSVTHALPQPVPLVADAAGAGLILASFIHALPPFAALLAVVWYLIQIYESDTMRKLLHLRRSQFRRQGRPHRHHHDDGPHDIG